MRRSERDKFLWCVMELGKFNDISLEKNAAKAIVTNLINRMKILLMEDMNPGDMDRIYNGINLLEEYEKDRSNRFLLMNFTDVVMGAKKNRVTSYVNNWWRTRDFEPDDLKIDKCLKYRLNGDTDELLILGENLIKFIEEKDERIFGVYMKMVNLEGKMGLRYRRKDPVYLFWVIMRDYMVNDKMIKIFDFALDRFFNKGMKERFYFGFWIGVMVWKIDNMDFNVYDYPNFGKDDEVEYYENMEKIKLDDYVLNDFHVNKNFGLADFALNGAFVKDEYMKLLGENAGKYKEYYIEVKNNTDTKGNGKKKPVKKVKVDIGVLEFIDWNDIEVVKIIEEGVCGGKLPCIIVNYSGDKKILKEMRKSMNYGKDYIIVDECKKLVGLRDMNMKRIKSNKGLVKKDTKNKSYVNNCKIDDKDCIYCMMDYWDNIGDLGKNKDKLKDIKVIEECLKIRYFDGLFRSSDNILRNILVNKEGKLLSIDEGDIFGKRKYILNMNSDWCRTSCDKVLVDKVVNYFIENKEMLKIKVKEVMVKYDFDKSDEFNKRIDNYKDIVDYEWDIY
tara:strand:+ start:294 stop:1970 length:1677 start_codon:yes stop_codon:yes gene_type:complete